MKKYYVEDETIELTIHMSKKAYYFIGNIKYMSKEDFDEDVEYIAKEILSCRDVRDNPISEIDEKELSIDTSVMGCSVKYHLIEFKTLWCEDTDTENMECIECITEKSIVQYLTELHEYYKEYWEEKNVTENIGKKIKR